MAGFEIFATVTASTKRQAAPTSGKTVAPVTNIASLACTPLDPVDAELSKRLGLDTPGELLQTFVDGGLDIRQGDYLTVASVDYPIRACEDWTWQASGFVFRRLILEDLKR
jgi:hypothetical protein